MYACVSVKGFPIHPSLRQIANPPNPPTLQPYWRHFRLPPSIPEPSIRYWQYSAAELRAEVTDGFEAHTLPLDLLNMDTAWHRNYCFLENVKSGGCTAVPGPNGGSIKGYGGLFEWDTNLFPPHVVDTTSDAALDASTDAAGGAAGGAIEGEVSLGATTDTTGGVASSGANPFAVWLAQRNLSSYLDIHQCPGVLKVRCSQL